MAAGPVRPQADSQRSAHSGPVGLDGDRGPSRVWSILKTCDVQWAAGGAHHAI